MTRPTVTRVTFDLPKCEELRKMKRNTSKHKNKKKENGKTRKWEKNVGGNNTWKKMKIKKKSPSKTFFEFEKQNEKTCAIKVALLPSDVLLVNVCPCSVIGATPGNGPNARNTSDLIDFVHVVDIQDFFDVFFLKKNSFCNRSLPFFWRPRCFRTLNNIWITSRNTPTDFSAYFWSSTLQNILYCPRHWRMCHNGLKQRFSPGNPYHPIIVSVKVWLSNIDERKVIHTTSCLDVISLYELPKGGEASSHFFGICPRLVTRCGCFVPCLHQWLEEGDS